MNIQQYGLRHSDLKDMVAVFNKYPPIQEAILFGSRAKGTYKKGSDVDIALLIVGDKNCKLLVSSELNEDTLMPYRFDILALNDVDNLELLDHINRVGVVIYEKRNTHEQYAHKGR